MNLWPPFLFTGIRVRHISDSFREVEVSLALRWYNRNYFGTHFGGSLFAMTDPFYALILAHNLGRDYIVWDKSSSIDFVSPGRGVVRALFRVDDEQLQAIRDATACGEKALPAFVVDVIDENGAVVAALTKTVYVRKKRPRKALAASSS